MNGGQTDRAAAELRVVLRVLDDLADLVVEGEPVYISSADRRARLRYLWIVVGSRLKNYCQVMDIRRATGPFGLAIGFRHTWAYGRPDRVDDTIVWLTSLHELSALRSAVSETLDAVGA